MMFITIFQLFDYKVVLQNSVAHVERTKRKNMKMIVANSECSGTPCDGVSQICTENGSCFANGKKVERLSETAIGD